MWFVFLPKFCPYFDNFGFIQIEICTRFSIFPVTLTAQKRQTTFGNPMIWRIFLIMNVKESLKTNFMNQRPLLNCLAIVMFRATPYYKWEFLSPKLLYYILLQGRDVNVLIFLNFSFRYDSVHQKYLRLKRYVAHYEILWHRVTLRNEFSALEYLIQR